MDPNPDGRFDIHCHNSSRACVYFVNCWSLQIYWLCMIYSSVLIAFPLMSLYIMKITFEHLCQKQAWRAGTSNYIPQFMWDVITWSLPLILLPEASIKGRDNQLHPTIFMGCNYLPLPLIPASGICFLLSFAQANRYVMQSYVRSMTAHNRNMHF